LIWELASRRHDDWASFLDGGSVQLPEPLNVAFAIGALAGLRTGEVLGLRWSHVDLSKKRITSRRALPGRSRTMTPESFRLWRAWRPCSKRGESATGTLCMSVA